MEQLHKIFKLCGSPSDDYWKKSKLPHATIFKPQQSYKRCIAETFKDFPPSSLPLIETLLAIDPAERRTATAALRNEVRFYISLLNWYCSVSFSSLVPYKLYEILGSFSSECSSLSSLVFICLRFEICWIFSCDGCLSFAVLHNQTLCLWTFEPPKISTQQGDGC